MTGSAINASNAGKLYGLGGGGDSYATVHNAADGFAGDNETLVEIGQDYTTGTDRYNVRRGGLVFDTSVIPTSMIILAATLTLYGWAKDVDVDFSLTVVSGADLGDALVDADYGDLLDDTTSLGSILASDFLVGVVGVAQENQITLNSTGLAAITRGGTTRFGLRSSRDISSTAPTNNVYEYIQFLGTGSSPIPRLDIAYGFGEGAGAYEVVETRFHYVDAYGVERALLGEVVS